jgi:anti-sigma regulatory factor (Ser/Thr protein kinase)
MFYSETLPKSPAAPARARGILDRVRAEVAPEVLDDARLLVSELVANAVEHVREDGDIEVRIRVLGNILRVEVLDPGPGFTFTPRAPDAGHESGWGLHFTDRVAQRWAIDTDGRNRVWFELARHRER